MEISALLTWHFGPGSPATEESRLLALLDAIERTGSIASAARELQLSYRGAWGLIEKWQLRFGRPLLDATRGSGSSLSHFASQLTELNRRLGAQLSPRLAAAQAEMRRLFAAGEHIEEARLTVTASHDLALIRLQELMQADGHAIELQFRGSLASLQLLTRGACGVAGFHCAEGELGERMWRDYARFLQPRKHVLLPLARRTQGFMVASGNPKKLRSVADLARPNVRFLNRQPGAGTRLLLDLLLQQQGIEGSRVKGYNSEEHTHAAVAALIAGGEADVGMGIEAAARRFGLDFIPVVNEDYFLAVERKRLREAWFVALQTCLASERFREALAGLAGYQAPASIGLLEVGETAPRIAAEGTISAGARKRKSASASKSAG